jgi:hypothetical protein
MAGIATSVDTVMPIHLKLVDGTHVDLNCEDRDGIPIVSVAIKEKFMVIEMSAAQACEWADYYDDHPAGGTRMLANAFRSAAEQSRQLTGKPGLSEAGADLMQIPVGASRQILPGERVIMHRPQDSRPCAIPAAIAALNSHHRRVIEYARQMAAAAGEGPDAVAGLLACSNRNDVYPVAFSVAIGQIRGLLAIVDKLADQACRELKEWSTTEELCEWLGIELTALYWLNSTGHGPQRHRIGKWNRYRRGEIERWLATRSDATEDRSE